MGVEFGYLYSGRVEYREVHIRDDPVSRPQADRDAAGFPVGKVDHEAFGQIGCLGTGEEECKEKDDDSNKGELKR